MIGRCRTHAMNSAFVRWTCPAVLAASALGAAGVVAFRRGVEHNVRATFRRVGQRDYETLLKLSDPSVVFGGTRQTRDALRRWFERLFVLFPGLRFEVKEVAVRGWPWDATVMVQYIDSQRVAEVCRRLAGQGVSEAAAEPVTDRRG